MKFDIAFLSSHGTARGHYLVGLCRNFDCNFTFAGVDNDSSSKYSFLINNKLRGYKALRGNVINIDNSLGSRSAPVSFYNKMFKKDVLLVNLVRDPLKKFCTVYNFFNYYHVVNKRYAALDCNIELGVKRLFFQRFWDNMMSLPFVRFSNSNENFVFLDSEDLREQRVRSTFGIIQKRSSLNMDVPKDISLYHVSSYKEKFFEAYDFSVIYRSVVYTFKLSTCIQDEKKLCVQVENDELLELFSVEFLYAYTVSAMSAAVDVIEFARVVESQFLNEMCTIKSVYRSYLDCKIDVDLFCEIVYSDVKLYDSFKYSVCEDAQYILGKYPKCEMYWDAFNNIGARYSAPINNLSSEYVYEMRNGSGAYLLTHGWGSVHNAGVDAISSNVKICMPVRSMKLSLVTMNYYSSCSGKVKICVDGNEIASGNLQMGCLCFPLPKVLVANKKVIELDIDVEQDCDSGLFTLYSIINSLQ